jgi:hypothetical protein
MPSPLDTSGPARGSSVSRGSFPAQARTLKIGKPATATLDGSCRDEARRRLASGTGRRVLPTDRLGCGRAEAGEDRAGELDHAAANKSAGVGGELRRQAGRLAFGSGPAVDSGGAHGG